MRAVRTPGSGSSSRRASTRRRPAASPAATSRIPSSSSASGRLSASRATRWRAARRSRRPQTSSTGSSGRPGSTRSSKAPRRRTSPRRDRCRARSAPSRARSSSTTGGRAPRSPSGTCTSSPTASTAPSATTSSSVWRPPRSSRPTCGGRSRARSSSGGGSSTAWQAPSRIPQQARFDSPAPRPIPCELKSRTREARMQRLNRTVALVAMLLLLPAALSAQEELPHTYRGTVHAVHAGSVELVTGVRYERRRFARGKVVFDRVFTPEKGLGPLFNSTACGECHEKPTAGGRGDEVEVHATALKKGGVCDPLVEEGGFVVQQHTTPALKQALGIDQEPFPPSATARAKRTTAEIFARGLLDAVPESVILAYADPDDKNHDGISGRPNHSVDGRLGRFGRKAFVPTLAEFNAGAFVAEMGITNPAEPTEENIGGKPIPPGVDPVPDPEITQAAPDLHDGRATTLEQAIAAHGGEGSAARDRFKALTAAERKALIAFLDSL